MKFKPVVSVGISQTNVERIVPIESIATPMTRRRLTGSCFWFVFRNRYFLSLHPSVHILLRYVTLGKSNNTANFRIRILDILVLWQEVPEPMLTHGEDTNATQKVLRCGNSNPQHQQYMNQGLRASERRGWPCGRLSPRRRCTRRVPQVNVPPANGRPAIIRKSSAHYSHCRNCGLRVC